jgi:hypothetical protein
MSFDQLVVILLLVCGLALAVTSLANFAGAAVYDIQAARLRRERQAHPQARRYRQRPLVTVLIMAQNAETTIEACLDSLRRSSYRKLQIIVIDNASEDPTPAHIRAYLAAHPKFNGRLVAKRRSSPWSAALRQANTTYGQGELVMLLSAGSRVDRAALREMINYYQDHPAADVVRPKWRVAHAVSLGSLLQTYLGLLNQRPHKAAAVITRGLAVSGTDACYRREAFDALLGPAAKQDRPGRPLAVAISAPYAQAYTPGAIIHQSPAGSYYQLCRQYYQLRMVRVQARARKHHRPTPVNSSRLLAWLRASLSLSTVLTAWLAPLLVSYFIYLAAGLHEPFFLVLTMAAGGLLVLFAIWEDEGLRFRQRLIYTLGIPVTYSLFYGLAWLRLLTACRAVLTRQAV